MPENQQNHRGLKRWQHPTSGSSMGKPPASKRGRKLFFLLAIVLALGATIFTLLQFLQPTTPAYFLSISVSEYSHPRWPANPFAVQDSLQLIKHFPEDQSRYAFDCQVKRRLVEELEGLTPRDKQPLVVHLCAHALCQGEKVFIIPGEANPAKSDDWLPLEEVLNILKNNQSRKKLLILDIMRPIADPKLGVLYNDVAGKVKNLLEKMQEAKDLPLLVLCPCAENQVSLMLEEANLSVFAFFLDRGLQGDADGFGQNKDHNGTVTVKELAAYLYHHVDDWARRNRLTRQTPLLFGQGDDFALVLPKRVATEEELTEPAAVSYPKWLKEGWKFRDDLKWSETFLLAPRPFKQLEFLLLRAEKQWRGGLEEARVKKNFDFDLQGLKELFTDAQKLPKYPPRSLTLAIKELPQLPLVKSIIASSEEPLSEKEKGDKGKADKEKADKEKVVQPKPGPALDELLVKLQTGELKFDKKEDLAKAKPELDKFWKTLEKLEPPLVAKHILETLKNGTDLPSDKLRLAFELWQVKKNQLQFVETLLLYRLEQLRLKAEDKGWTWPVLASLQVVRTTLQCEQTISELRQVPFALPWVQKGLSQTDEFRRKGEEYLFAKRPETWSQAITALQQAEKDYRKIAGQIQILQKARADHGEAMSSLPAYVPYLVDQRSLLEEEDAWLSSVRETQELGKLLETPDNGLISLVEEKRITLGDQLFRLTNSFQGRITSLQKGDAETPETYLQMQAFLESSQLTSDQRLDLWLRARKLSLKLHQETLDDQHPGKSTSGNKIPMIKLEEVADRVAMKTERRTGYHIQLLKLAGAKTTELQEAFQKAKDKKSPENWYLLAQKLRDQWTVELPKSFFAAQNDYPTANRLSYLLYPFDKTGTRSKSEIAWSQNPTVNFNRVQHQAFWQWLGKRFQADHQLIMQATPELNFYAEAAEEYSR